MQSKLQNSKQQKRESKIRRGALCAPYFLKGIRNTEHGITLVALIITVIVLLILAIVSIRLVINGGIIDRAEKGTESYSEAEIKEQIKLAYSECQTAIWDGTSGDAGAFITARLQSAFGNDNVKNVSVLNGKVEAEIKTKGEFVKYSYDAGTMTLGIVEENNILLPDEYQQVEYIESTGTQYIDTGFKPNNKTKLSIYVEPTNIPETSSWFGARNANSDTEGIAFLLWQVGDSFRFDYNNQKQTSVRIENNKKISVLWDRNNIYIDNNLVSTFNETEFECPVTLILCSSKNNRVDGISVNEDNVDTRMSKLKIYNCSIWNNDVLVRKYIPCYKNSDNKPGLYDTVNNVFYTNQGSGDDFTIGPNVD